MIFYLVIIFLVGISIGSFLNVVIHRLSARGSLIHPPSHCPYCEQRLRFPELLPLAGYLIYRKRCRYCQATISFRYFFVELLTGLIFASLFMRFGTDADLVKFALLFSLLLAISLIDLEHRIVPNPLVAFGLLAGIVFYLPHLINLVYHTPSAFMVSLPPAQALWGALLGGGSLLIVFLVSRGGMGAGDIKLMIMIGFYFGLLGTVAVLFFGFMIGALVGIAFMVLRKLTRKDALPFAPFLSLAALIQVFWGTAIWNWYLNLL